MTSPAVHWTQRPENKEKVERMRKKGAQTLKARRKKNERKHSEKKPPKTQVGEDVRVVYAFAHVEAWLETYADGVELSRVPLTLQVAELLLAKARRKRMGSRDSMP